MADRVTTLRRSSAAVYCREHAFARFAPNLSTDAPVHEHSPGSWPATYGPHRLAMAVLVGRYYDPQTAQFLSVDPLIDETGQAYVYAGDDPVLNSDPNGDMFSPPATYYARNFSAGAPGKVGAGYYIATLNSAGRTHLQKHVNQLDISITRFYGFNPGLSVCWYYFGFGMYVSLLWPVRIVLQDDGRWRYETKIVIYNPQHVAKNYYWATVVIPRTRLIWTSFFSTKKSLLASVGG